MLIIGQGLKTVHACINFNQLFIMKKQNKKANALQPKHLQLDKTIISSFDAKQVKGGTGARTGTGSLTTISGFQNTGYKVCV